MLNKKRVLGRGLGALMGNVESPISPRPDKTVFMQLAIDDIVPSALQPRKRFDDNAIKELSLSIQEKGIIEPLIVRRVQGGFELIAGERRWRAGRLAGLKQVPAIVMQTTDQESLEFAIIENIQREDLNAIEEAEAYKSLMDFGMTQDEVAGRVGKDRATVANYLRLLRLPPEVKNEIINGRVSMGHARALLSLEGHGQQAELCKRIISKGLSVRETEEMVAGVARQYRPGRPEKRPMARYTELEDELRRIFGTKVSLKEKRTGAGSIVISFFSREERERVIELLRTIA